MSSVLEQQNSSGSWLVARFLQSPVTIHYSLSAIFFRREIRTNVRKMFHNICYLLFAICYLLFTATCLYGWFLQKGGSGFAVESLDSTGAFARTVALGNSGISYFNPASLTYEYYENFFATYLPLFFGGNFFSTGYTHPLDAKNIVDISIVGFGSADAQKTNELGEILGNFSSNEMAVRTSYARKINDFISAGARLKYITQTIDDHHSSAATLDIGASLHDNAIGNTYGISLFNIIPSKLGRDEISFFPRVGIRHNFMDKDIYLNFDFSFYNIFRGDIVNRWFFGAEYNSPEYLFWRFGLNQKQISAGLGLDFGKIGFDYGVLFHPLGFLHYFTVNIRYGFEPTAAEIKVKEEMGNLKEERERFAERRKIEKQLAKLERERLEQERKVSLIFLRARKKFDDKKFAEAEKLALDILNIAPQNKEATALLAEIRGILNETTIKRKLADMENFYRQGEYISALSESKWVLNLLPNHEKAKIYYFLSNARILISEKKYMDAKGELLEVLKVQSVHDEALGLLRRIQTVIDMEEQ